MTEPIGFDPKWITGAPVQSRLAAIIESSDDAIVSKTLSGYITSWNLAAQKLFGYTENEAIGKHISIIIPSDRMEEEEMIISKIKKGEKVDHFETYRLTKWGTTIPLSITVSAIRDPNGNIIGASKIARDISEQKLSEELIRRNAENQDILNAIGKAISGNFDVEAILQKVTDACTKLVDAQFGAFFYNTINESGEPFRLFTLSGTAREAFFGRDMPQHTEIYGIPFNDKDIYRSDDITKDQQYDHPRRNEIPGSHLHVTSYLSVPVVSKEGSVVGGLFFGHSEPAKFTHQHERLMEGVSSQAAIALDNAKLVNEVRVLNSKKDEFIGLASHELKTPVTSIKGYLQILEKNQDISGMSRTFIAKALQQTDKLAGLISDLLDVSKIEAGKLPLNLAVFDLGELIKDVIEVLGHEYHSHRIEFTVEHGPLLVHADRSRIEQVIINLLSNAVKYSPAAGHVVVRGNHTEGQIIVSVRDFGIGIQKQHQSNIFSRFYRVDDLAHHISGLGIGLYISNEIIIRHHGAMWVESEFEKGSTFYFSLPPAGQ